MFKKVMVANRGAIAVRVIRTLKKMGVKSVAVYAEADRYSLHVDQADQAFSLGEGPARDTYLDQNQIINLAQAEGVEAIHPGYGFLSENAEFAQKCADAGIVFLGPTPEQMTIFGLKHTAREQAQKVGVPMLNGTPLMHSVEEALSAAEEIGFPLMIKSSAGGGGIGMEVCHSAEELSTGFERVKRLSANNFGNDGVFLERFIERARHIEVQVVGDGQGHVVHLGERDCSAQRRNQKVVEETPAPGLSQDQRRQIWQAAVNLASSVEYESAGTVEFLLDDLSGEFYFLEMNTRLQVEHGVTEEISGVDLVEWMVRIGARELDLSEFSFSPQGASIQVRLYAEDPDRNFQPCTGILSCVKFDESLRIESWVKKCIEITPWFDPMLAKLIVHGKDRADALQKLNDGLKNSAIEGVETNLTYLQDILKSTVFADAKVTTSWLSHFTRESYSAVVLRGGTETTVQDLGRLGYWQVGVPPSGPADAQAFRVGNQIVGNPENAAAIEVTLTGPQLRFLGKATICLTGADMNATVNEKSVARYTPVNVNPGDVLDMGQISLGGLRAYLCIRGGVDVPLFMGSRATFTLGKFGGYKGRALQAGDKLSYHGANSDLLDENEEAPDAVSPDDVSPAAVSSNDASAKLQKVTIPVYQNSWKIRVMSGPHGSPDFFNPEYIDIFLATQWEVHFNSSRTGIRLIGPNPGWVREDGGEAGLHPSNIHDTPYAVGAIDFTGDMPIILGPDGPSLGGFVCPFTIIEADLWMTGQLRPGDLISFVPVNFASATAAVNDVKHPLEVKTAKSDNAANTANAANTDFTQNNPTQSHVESPVLADYVNQENMRVVYRQSGDWNLLVEYGEMQLDFKLRFRVHVLMELLQQEGDSRILELTPGIRSLQVKFNGQHISQNELVAMLRQKEQEIPPSNEIKVPSRIVHLPLSWDDPATQLAIKRYLSGVRANAPWGPSNIEFIRRINGLESVDDVYRILFDASYLVLGLGDVYLGAPVATPVDPRHRLVTTKYNPARTWTPENAVGIGGAYMCIYGMEGPGGYQFVGRTIPVWNSYGQSDAFESNKPWLLRFFDQIRFYPVSADELLQMRKDFLHNRFQIQVEETTFDLGAYNKFLEDIADEANQARTRQQSAFEEERLDWKRKGLDEFVAETQMQEDVAQQLPEGCQEVRTIVPGSIWKVDVEPGQQVKEGDVLVITESMKTEFPILAPCDGVVEELFAKEGSTCGGGQVVLWIREH